MIKGRKTIEQTSSISVEFWFKLLEPRETNQELKLFRLYDSKNGHGTNMEIYFKSDGSLACAPFGIGEENPEIVMDSGFADL